MDYGWIMDVLNINKPSTSDQTLGICRTPGRGRLPAVAPWRRQGHQHLGRWRAVGGGHHRAGGGGEAPGGRPGQYGGNGSCRRRSSVWGWNVGYPLVILHGYRKSPSLIGKPSISMGHLYHGELLVYQRVMGKMYEIVGLNATWSLFYGITRVITLVQVSKLGDLRMRTLGLGWVLLAGGHLFWTSFILDLLRSF